MLRLANLATNVNPDLGHLFAALGIFNYPILMKYDYNMNGYVKVTVTCSWRNIFRGS